MSPNLQRKPKLSSLNDDLFKRSRTRSVSDLLSSQIKEKKKKKSILETLNNKPLKEQYLEIEHFWASQVTQINKHSISFKTIQFGAFDLKITSNCQISEHKSPSQVNTHIAEAPDFPGQQPSARPGILSDLAPERWHKPISQLVQDCSQAKVDAQKWFISTMHLYIKIKFAEEIRQGTLVPEPSQNGFFRSLYSSYSKKGDARGDKAGLKRLDLLKQSCWNIKADDVMDSYGADILEIGSFYFFLFFFLNIQGGIYS